MVAEHKYSLRFEDCYFKKADRKSPFSSFKVAGNASKLNWQWDELSKDTWVTSNKGDVLTGNKKNGFLSAIQFTDGDGDGNVLATNYLAGTKENPAMRTRGFFNNAPAVAVPLADIAVYQDSPTTKINLLDVFEDDQTSDENLKFSVNSENASLFTSTISDGILTLNCSGIVGEVFVTVTATDDHSKLARSTQETFMVIVVEGESPDVSDLDEWYVDKKEGNDKTGAGSQYSPFRSIDRVLSINDEYPGYLKDGETIHLGGGRYRSELILIDIPNLKIKGTLDASGKPITVLDDTKIKASGVSLENCEFFDASLTLENVENVLISNNYFSGSTESSLLLLGASNNKIQYNEFKSAIHDCVHIYWDPASGNASLNNIFLRNYFTHREGKATQRIVRVNWLSGHNESISGLNQFIKCAFVEKERGKLKRVIDDDTSWWMVSIHQYSVKFVDCYFKRADRINPLSEFAVLDGYPNFIWRWDELMNDTWVSTNTQCAITGDHSGWKHRPRILFVDGDGNNKVLETAYSAGLLAIETGTDP